MKQEEMPEFPTVEYELGWRNTVEKDLQQEILDEIHRLTYHINPKIYLFVDWLKTYISIRPAEMRSMDEKHINAKSGYFSIMDTKSGRREGKPKPIPMTDEDLAIVRALPRGFPEMPFFRHNEASAKRGGERAKAGNRFGQKFIYKWWKRACKNLGIEGVDLYGGTKHSSATALADDFSPEQIIKATMHDTNKAFLRYCQTRPEHVKKLYESSRKPRGQSDQIMTPN